MRQWLVYFLCVLHLSSAKVGPCSCVSPHYVSGVGLWSCVPYIERVSRNGPCSCVSLLYVSGVGLWSRVPYTEWVVRLAIVRLYLYTIC